MPAPLRPILPRATADWDLLHIAGTVTMLVIPHAVVDDDPLRLGVDFADGLDI